MILQLKPKLLELWPWLKGAAKKIIKDIHGLCIKYRILKKNLLISYIEKESSYLDKGWSLLRDHIKYSLEIHWYSYNPKTHGDSICVKTEYKDYSPRWTAHLGFMCSIVLIALIINKFTNQISHWGFCSQLL